MRQFDLPIIGKETGDLPDLEEKIIHFIKSKGGDTSEAIQEVRLLVY